MQGSRYLPWLRYIEWLTTGLTGHDSLVFLFSGHGSQVPDRTGEEWDGLCETVLPLDHARAGAVSDKELSELGQRREAARAKEWPMAVAPPTRLLHNG